MGNYLGRFGHKKNLSQLIHIYTHVSSRPLTQHVFLNRVAQHLTSYRVVCIVIDGMTMLPPRVVITHYTLLLVLDLGDVQIDISSTSVGYWKDG